MGSLLTTDDSAHVRYMAHDVLIEQRRPFFLLAGHIRMFIDGNQWCALYGENLQDGVAGFGDTPDAASSAFDISWYEKLPSNKP